VICGFHDTTKITMTNFGYNGRTFVISYIYVQSVQRCKECEDTYIEVRNSLDGEL